MTRLICLLALATLAACNGDDTDTDVDTGTEVDTDTDSDSSGPQTYAGTDVTVRVAGDIGDDWRVSIQKAVISELFDLDGEVVGGPAMAEMTLTIPEVTESELVMIDDQEGVIYFVVLHDDANGDGVLSSDELIGVSARAPVVITFGPDASWIAADLTIEGDPDIVELSEGVDLEALPHRDSITIEAAWGDNLVDVDRISTFSPAEVGTGILADRPFDAEADTNSPFTVTVSAPLQAPRLVGSEFAADIGQELLLGLNDVDNSGSVTNGDLKTASVCFGTTEASLVYLPPGGLSVTTLLIANLFGLPSGWSVGSNDSDDNFVILTDAEALDLDIIAGDGCDPS